MDETGRASLTRAGTMPRRLRSPPAVAFCLILLAGCRAEALRDRYGFAATQSPHVALLPVAADDRLTAADLSQVEGLLEAGRQEEQAGRETCVDRYYQAAIGAWRLIDACPARSGGLPSPTACNLYQQSLERLIASALRYRRLNPQGQLTVDCGGRRLVPIQYVGFAWKPAEFSQVLLAREFQNGDLQHRYRATGLGVSLVAVRHGSDDEPFYRAQQPFPVTALLRSGLGETTDELAPGRNAVLTFYNPCLFSSVRLGNVDVPLERDLSAPFAYLIEQSPRRFTEGFLAPDDADVQPKLLMMEPYQPGKIPLVFIHGLWSDPMTWVDTANALRAQSDIYRNYQFWFFRYPTGGDLLESAAALREQMMLVRELHDPLHRDPALERTVLVGHSMGGLVAKLQASHSYDTLWRHAAKRPIETVRASPAMRDRLQRIFFFAPSPLVQRLVFIATPHQGSGMSRRLVGRVASRMVRYSSDERDAYRELMDSNRDVFQDYLWNSRPTTVGLLEPSNPMLQAMAKMPIGCGIRTHSIIGNDWKALTSESSDGVVPVSSARYLAARSELIVPARHEEVHRHPDTIDELLRILREHGGKSVL